MGKQRLSLPPVPMRILSEQQRLVYQLASRCSTGEISKTLSIPEKQVRQVYTAIRRKAQKFANKNVPPAHGAEPALFQPSGGGNFNGILAEGPAEKDRCLLLTDQELFVSEQVEKGVSIKQIADIMGKSVQSVRKTRQRANKKLRQKNLFIDDNCTIKIDTGKTYVHIDFKPVKLAMARMNLTREQVAKDTGILPGRMEEIERSGVLTYDELFSLARRLDFNPYGPAEKDWLLKKVKDTNWIRLLREDEQNRSGAFGKSRARRINEDKTRYRNRVMYYATSCFRLGGHNRDRPVIEAGRNGLFPVELTREQQALCREFLDKYRLRPVYTYRYPGLEKEIRQIEDLLGEEEDQVRAGKYRRKIVHLKEDIVPENGKSVYIVNHNQMLSIRQILFDPGRSRNIP